MKYEKKCKVVALNSHTKQLKNGSIVYMCSGDSGASNYFVIYDYKKHYGLNGVFKHPKNLYILAPLDEEINIGDIVFNHHEKNIEIVDTQDKIKFYKTFKIRKVIASDNSNLIIPRPSNEFRKKYCEAGGIDEVMVEYTTCKALDTDVCLGHIFCEECVHNLQKPTIKVAPDNTITIRKIKDTWTREEVEELIKKAWADRCWEGTFGYIETSGDDAEDWIAKNL